MDMALCMLFNRSTNKTFREPCALNDDLILLLALMAVIGASAIRIVYEMFFNKDTEERSE